VRDPVTLGTATPGGGFPVYGQAADTINQVDPTLEVRPRNTRGGTENVPLLEAGQLDLALVQGEVAHEALAGIGRTPADLRILAAMYSTAGMFVVRADSPYRAIDDLKGRPVAFGARGSGLIILARYVLDGLGLDRDRDGVGVRSYIPTFAERNCPNVRPDPVRGRDGGRRGGLRSRRDRRRR
jgi:TRAP transporter TAXI family solute receptor